MKNNYARYMLNQLFTNLTIRITKIAPDDKYILQSLYRFYEIAHHEPSLSQQFIFTHSLHFETITRRIQQKVVVAILATNVRVMIANTSSVYLQKQWISLRLLPRFTRPSNNLTYSSCESISSVRDFLTLTFLVLAIPFYLS